MVCIRKLLVASAGILLSVFFSTGAYASYQMHTVKENDTFYKIADQYSTNLNVLQTINYQSSENLKTGELIKISKIKDISVKVNDKYIAFDVQPYIENGRVFVPLRFVSETMKADSIDWNQTTKTATIKEGTKTVSVTVGSSTARVDGRTVRLDAPVQLYGGRTFVPIRFFSEIMNADNITWDQSSYTVSIYKNGLVVNEEYVAEGYSQEDLYWLSRIVEAEAEAEPYEGKVAVANTIINRKNSLEFPDTIKGVIFDDQFGFQYTPVRNGHIYNTPSEESIRAAKAALEGYNNIGDSMYFINPVKSPDSWVANNRTYYTTIENHTFYL